MLKPGSTIPVAQTQSTIPGDLLQNVMRLPYRQRFTLIINELGAAVAARSEDLGSALRRAVPALAETDNLLNVLANDSSTIQQLTANSDSVVTALANNTARDHPLHRRGRPHRADQRHPAGRACAAPSSSCRASSSSCGPRWPSSAARPTPTRRRCENLHAAAEPAQPPARRPARLLALLAAGDPLARPGVGDRSQPR